MRYKVRSVEISSVTTMTTTKTIKYIRTEHITPEGMTGVGLVDEVEFAALPAPSPRGRVQRSEDMGIIGRDERELCPRGEGGIRPRGSGGRRPPSIVGRPCAEA